MLILTLASAVWDQSFRTIQQILILQKKAVTIINFQSKNFYTSLLFKQNSIFKFQDKICLENILFLSKSLNNSSPSAFNSLFIYNNTLEASGPQKIFNFPNIIKTPLYNLQK